MNNATKTFIEDGIKGKYLLEKFNLKIESFKYTEWVGNGKVILYWTDLDDNKRGSGDYDIEVLLLDPEFFKAVGKTRGWVDKDYPNGEMRCENLVGRCNEVYCSYGGFIDPNDKQHDMIDALQDGSSIEEYLKTIEK